MNEFNFFTYVCCHLIGDYYLQSDQMAEEKQQDKKTLFLHMFVYILPFYFIWIVEGMLVKFKWELFFIITVIGIVHALIDYMKYVVQKRNIVKKDVCYVVDQLLHIMILLIFSQFSMGNLNLLYQLGDNGVVLIKWITYILIILKPANITFKELYAKMKDNKDVDTRKAGAKIGSMERLLIALFLFLQQYSAAALVLTAKSITRYNKISTEPNFAEYYLIGTLYSLIVSVLFYVLLFFVLV